MNSSYSNNRGRGSYRGRGGYVGPKIIQDYDCSVPECRSGQYDINYGSDWDISQPANNYPTSIYIA